MVVHCAQTEHPHQYVCIYIMYTRMNKTTTILVHSERTVNTKHEQNPVPHSIVYTPELWLLEPRSLPGPASRGRIEGLLGLLDLSSGIGPVGSCQPRGPPVTQQARLVLILERGRESTDKCTDTNWTDERCPLFRGARVVLGAGKGVLSLIAYC